MVQAHPNTKSNKQARYLKLQEQVNASVRADWVTEQARLKQQLEEEDRFSWRLDRSDPSQTTLTRVAAVDISYSKRNQKQAVAALVVLAFPSMEVLYEDFELDTTAYPYIPGFLAFKEVPSYQILFDRLRKEKPELYPELVLVDGNGILHTRSFGCASHVGVLFDVPTVGVGKTVFYVDGIREVDVNAMAESELRQAGDSVPLVGLSGKTWGAALRATDRDPQPLIVSQGHRVSL